MSRVFAFDRAALDYEGFNDLVGPVRDLASASAANAEPSDTDPLATARGILLGVQLSIAFWAAVLVVAYALRF
jgi:hypothetical protein